MTDSKRILAAVVMLVALTAPSQAQAYLDPATGSMIVSGIVAVFATIVMAVTTYWNKLLSLFRGRSASSDEAERKDDPQELPRA